MKLCYALVASALLAAPGQAAVIIDVSQMGADVVATTTGTFNLSGLAPHQDAALDPGIIPYNPQISTGGTQLALVNAYYGILGPNGFGANQSFISATSATGVSFGVNTYEAIYPGYIFVPLGYVSGDSLAGTATFANATISSLGLNPGTYVFSSAVDSVTVNINAASAVAPVPEPATWAMMLLGMGAIGFFMRRRNQQPKVRFAF